MKLRLSFLLCLSALVSGSAFGTSIPVRSTGAYGLTPSIGPVTTLDGGSNFQEAVVCQAGFTSDGCTGSGPYDMLLAFTDDTQDGHAFTLSLATFTPATTTNNGSGNSQIPNTFTFGVLSCGAQAPVVNNGTTFCTDLTNTTLNTDATNCEHGLAGEFDSGGNYIGTNPITISAACVASGMTLYFDETASDVAAPNFNSGTSPAPEPGSLLLLGSGLLALAGRFRRILPA